MKFHFRHHDNHAAIGGVIVPADHPSALLVIDAHGSQDNVFRTADNEQKYDSNDREYALDASRHHGAYTRRRAPSPPVGCGPECTASSQGLESPTNRDGGSPTSKRALHLEHHESECPVANPDPHSRPRSRQFFRLGRHRSKGIDRAPSHNNNGTAVINNGQYCGGTSSDSSDGEDDGLTQSEQHTHRTRGGRRTTSKAIANLRKPRIRRAQSLPAGISPGMFAKAKSMDPVVGNSEWMSASERLFRKNPEDDSASDDRLSQSEYTVRTSRGHRRTVTFSSVQIREYSTILGDHPCCPSGPPLSLGWDLERENSMELEVYEKEREPCRVRCKEEMRLDGEVRRDILQSLVVTSPTASGDEASDGDDNDCSSSTEKQQSYAVYSQLELRRAERRLTRERAGNSRMHRRMNRGFFRPLTAEECEIAGSTPVVITATEDSAEEPEVVGSPMKEDSADSCCSIDVEESSRMDISPAKSSTATSEVQ